MIQFIVGSYARQNSTLGPLLRRVPLNATTRQVLSLERGEQRAYLDKLWRFNHAAGTLAASTGSSALYQMRKFAGLVRRFNQLPCTVDTRRRRADLLNDCDKDRCRILVLGDDDLLSVELSRRGFRQVTVADCDERLLARLRQETQQYSTPPRIVRADFRQGFVCPEPMDVVFTDPPYSFEGAQAFLRLAVASVAPTGRIFLMVNPEIFGSTFKEISATAVRAGFQLRRHLPAFNAYPIGILEDVALRLSWRLLLNAPAPKTGGNPILFCSDCLEFGRGDGD